MEKSTSVRFDEKATCNRCGQFGAYLFDGERLCGACYETRGSCCPEFGQDDLWTNDAVGDKRPRCETREKR